jgi:hypothetical protein
MTSFTQTKHFRNFSFKLHKRPKRERETTDRERERERERGERKSEFLFRP